MPPPGGRLELTSMSFLKKLLGRTPEPTARVRVCIECGKPVEDHASWCAIYRTQQEMDAKRASGNSAQ
jgi:hypothetical protein